MNILFLFHLLQVDGEVKEVPRILVSVVYTYALIIQAAKMTQASERWKDDEKINTLMFSSKSVRTE